MKKHSGVTLMEIIVVVAIIAILAGVAFPNYKKAKQTTYRSEAQTAVIATQGIVERYLGENNKGNIDSGDMALAQFADFSTSSGTPELTNNGFYRITIMPDSTGYAINATATITGGLSDCDGEDTTDQCADTACRVISINHGEKESANSMGVVADASTTACW